MLGAITGDTIGSVYEFNNTKDYNFTLFLSESNFTDDSVMTMAVARWLLNDPTHSYQGLEDAMLSMAFRISCPMGGYGTGFFYWIFKPYHLKGYNPRYGELPYKSTTGRHPYGSWGNGSAMRVSPVGWFFDTLEETERVAAVSAAITHNHPEGIKGAQATAAAIWLARNGKSKETIRAYIEQHYGYDLHKTYEYWHPIYNWESSCQATVPQAIICFLDSTDFEDAIRKAVSLGGDSDTLACITGGIAEAFYGPVPETIASQVIKRLPAVFVDILKEFRERSAYGLLGRPKADKKEAPGEPTLDDGARRALLLWKMGLGDSNKRFSGEDFNPEKKEIATADSWKTNPMVEPAIEVNPDFHLDAGQMKVIAFGHIPKVMEDHWFMYCDDSHIRYYRSWTGLFVFDATYKKEEEGEGFVIDRLRIHPNGDAAQEYVRQQTALFKALLMDECGGDSSPYWEEFLRKE